MASKYSYISVNLKLNVTVKLRLYYVGLFYEVKITAYLQNGH